MSEETKETSRIGLKSFQLNKDLLEDLSTTINDEYVKTLKEEKDEFEKKYIKSEYTLKTKNKEIETQDFETILKHWNPKNFKEIEMSFRSERKRISIKCGGYWKLDISVSGNDSIWVSGLTKSFEDILEKYKSKNEFFHKPQAYVIYLGIPILLLVGILLIIDPLFEENVSGLEVDTKTDLEQDEESNGLSKSTVYFLVGGIMINSFWGWSELFHRLFPKIEMEGSSKPKIRKAVLSGILSLVVSIIAGGIIVSIQNLFN